MKAWIFQDSRQKAKLGDDCPWSVGYYGPDGKKKGKRIGSKSAAEKYQRKIEGQLAAGVYENISRKGWAEFEAEYESKVMASMEPRTRESAQSALNHFKRVVKPVKMRAITSKTIADYVAARRLEPKNKAKLKKVRSEKTREFHRQPSTRNSARCGLCCGKRFAGDSWQRRRSLNSYASPASCQPTSIRKTSRSSTPAMPTRPRGPTCKERSPRRLSGEGAFGCRPNDRLAD